MFWIFYLIYDRLGIMQDKKEFAKFIQDLQNNALLYINDENPPLIIADIIKKYQKYLIDWTTRYFFNITHPEGFLAHTLYQNQDNSLCVMMTAWNPNCGALPHNHSTWAVVTAVYGEDVNTLWDIKGDLTSGQVNISPNKKIICKEGEFIFLKANDFHSVHNHTNDVAISLQVYGRNPNTTNRVNIDPQTGIVKKWICQEILI